MDLQLNNWDLHSVSGRREKGCVSPAWTRGQRAAKALSVEKSSTTRKACGQFLEQEAEWKTQSRGYVDGGLIACEADIILTITPEGRSHHPNVTDEETEATQVK